MAVVQVVQQQLAHCNLPCVVVFEMCLLEDFV